MAHLSHAGHGKYLELHIEESHVPCAILPALPFFCWIPAEDGLAGQPRGF